MSRSVPLVAGLPAAGLAAIAGLALGTGLAALPRPAIAGAWTQAPGSGQVIASVSRRAAPIGSFASPTVDDDSNFVSLYFEVGLLEGLTMGGTAYVEYKTAEEEANTADVGLFLRKRLWQGQHGDVAAVQLGVKQPIDGLFGDSFGGPGADPTQEVSLRGLYGKGWGFDWGSAFVSTEFGYHLQLDGDEDELRTDITVGAQPWDCCMALLATYTTYVIGDSEESAVKIAPSLTYSFRRAPPAEGAPAPKPVTLQFGLSQDLLNINEGLGVQLGIWVPF